MPEKAGLPLALCGLSILQPLSIYGAGFALRGVGLEASERPAGLPGEAWVSVGGRRASGSFPHTSASGGVQARAGVDSDG